MRAAAAVLVALVACGGETPSRVTLSKPLTVPSATASVIEPVPLPVTHALYVDDDWRLAFERIGSEARFVLESATMNAKPIELLGSVRSDGTFDAKETRVADGCSLRGSVDSRHVEADIALKGKRRHVVLPALSPVDVGNSDIDATFAVTMGASRSRLVWKQRGLHVRARWQLLPGEVHELEGDVAKATGVFELVEKTTGLRWRGVGGDIARSGSSPLVLDGAVPTWEYPDVIVLPSGERVVPAERVERAPMGCVAGVVYPTVKPDGPINSTLRTVFAVDAPEKADHCDLTFAGGWWSESAYVITAFGSGWFALRQRAYSYMGGAHGLYSSSCRIADLKSGKLAELAKELSPASLAKLRRIVRAAILTEKHAASLTDVGFPADDAEIDASRSMCVVDDHGARFLEIDYGEMDAGGIYRFEAPPRIPAGAVQSLFPPGSMGAIALH